MTHGSQTDAGLTKMSKFLLIPQFQQTQYLQKHRQTRSIA